MRFIIMLCLLSLPAGLLAQVLEVELLDGTSANTVPHPTEAFIFHMISSNASEGTILVDIAKSNEEMPSDWDISICTNACLPPEVDEATYYIPGEGSTEVSIYFFARSTGEGSVEVTLTNPSDTSESYAYTFTLMADAALGWSEPQSAGSEINYSLYAGDLNLEIPERGQLSIYDRMGRIQWSEELNPGLQTRSLDHLSRGFYLLVFQSDKRKTGQWIHILSP
ncbi:MAG: hypothetical protein HKN79_04745 [Flavobacteriales bacterium]|nr:hypothetical protein [Flavobacteriales bacterium]